MCLDALTDEQLWWRANEKSNSVANLMIHHNGQHQDVNCRRAQRGQQKLLSLHRSLLNLSLFGGESRRLRLRFCRFLAARRALLQLFKVKLG